jgi:uncharacterized protein (TIGR02996 family)
MTDEDDDDQALLAAIRAAPDDDAPRLVYADRLMERGDPRGEMIVLQCRDARGDKIVHERLKALLDAHGAAWRAHLPPRVMSSDFVRGFVHRVALGNRGELLSLAPALAALSPVPQQILLGGRARGAMSPDGTRVAAAESVDEQHNAGTSRGRWLIRIYTLAEKPTELATITREWRVEPWVTRGFLSDLRFTSNARSLVIVCQGEKDEIVALP